MKTSSRAHTLGWTIGAVLVWTSCAQPELTIRVEPSGTWVYVDGRFASPGRVQTPATGADDAPRYERAPKYVEPFDHEMPMRYYGTTRLSARRPAVSERGDPAMSEKGEKDESLTVDWLELRQDVTIDEPFSPWLFPFDFVLECVTYPFAADLRYAHRTTIELQKRPEVIDGILPRDHDATRARAKRAREER